MKKDLGDHIGKKKGWAWYELFELIKLEIIKVRRIFNTFLTINRLFFIQFHTKKVM